MSEARQRKDTMALEEYFAREEARRSELDGRRQGDIAEGDCNSAAEEPVCPICGKNDEVRHWAECDENLRVSMVFHCGRCKTRIEHNAHESQH